MEEQASNLANSSVSIVGENSHHVELDSTILDSITTLLHQLIKMVKRIPCLSSVSVARRLANLVERVVSKNDTGSWADLLSFPKMSLHISARGDKRWSLATLINKQVAQFSSHSETFDTPVYKHPNPSKKTDYLTFLS